MNYLIQVPGSRVSDVTEIPLLFPIRINQRFHRSTVTWLEGQLS